MTTPTLIFATNNQHKADEIRRILNERFIIKTLKDADITIDIPEPYDTLEENAREKSTVIQTLTGVDCFSEDTGLEVAALNGAPGVKSARYAGEDGDFKNNIEKLLLNMKGVSDRNAQFRTVISLLISGKEYQFEGICKGKIIEEQRGENGFGYDPVFVPNGSDKTFAEMNMDDKAIFSHRKKATQQLIDFLNQLDGKS
jgi:XTP/dITP diphosphohydrolase